MNIKLGVWKGILGQGLAPRELECVLAVANGKTVKEAAKILGMAPSTTAKRIASAMYKLGVNRQAALVAAAFAQGIISFAGVGSPTPEHQRDESHDGVFIA